MTKTLIVPAFRLSKQIAANYDAATNKEEVAEQIEEDDVKKAAREDAAGVPIPTMTGNDEIQTADDAVASREEVDEQAERKRIEKKAFESRISAASAEKWIRNGRSHE